MIRSSSRHRNGARGGAGILVTDLPGKGRGLVACRAYTPDEPVALYRVRRLAPSESALDDGTYQVKIPCTDGSTRQYDLATTTADDDATAHVPYVAHLANEPSLGTRCNSRLCVQADYPGNDDLVVDLILEATRSIRPGDEITWCYGPSYERRGYKTRCCHRRRRGSIFAKRSHT